MRADCSASGSGVCVPLVDVGEFDVVAHQADLDAPLGELGRHLRRHLGQEVEDPARRRTGHDGRDALGHFGHRLVAELADRGHVGTQALDHQ